MQILSPGHILNRTLCNNTNNFQQVTFVTMSSIINAAWGPKCTNAKSKKSRTKHPYDSNILAYGSAASNIDELINITSSRVYYLKAAQNVAPFLIFAINFFKLIR